MRNRYILLGDLILIVLAAFGAFALRFEWRFYESRAEFVPFLVAAVLIKPPTLYFFGMYRRLWRYASIGDLVAIVTAVLASSIALTVFTAAALWRWPDLEFSRTVLLIDGLLTLVLVGALRLSVRVLAESRLTTDTPESPGTKRVLIVGAGDAGVMVVRELQRNRQLGMVPVGFLDDDPVKWGKQIHGVTVLGGINRLVAVAQARAVDEVLIAIPTAGGPVLRTIAESCRQSGLSSQTIPGVFELLDGQVSLSRLRQIDISDLLRRAPVSGEVNITSYVTGRVVLVTGAGGSIGSELCRQVAAAHPSRLIMLGHGENSLFDSQSQLREAFPNLRLDVVIVDIRDRPRLQTVLEHLRPKVVFHAAAHKHVPLMEENPQEAISNNVVGTRNMVEASLSVGVERFVMISTDKAVAPTNIMGASKRLAEAVVRHAAARRSSEFAVVRFGNVLGSRGSVVPFFKRQIERGGPITVTHPDMRRFFMTIPEAVHLVLQAGGIGRGGELFVLEMGAPVRIVDLAQDMITLSGFKPEEIPIVFTGVRRGEKLDEALWEPGAIVEPTECPSVLRVTEPDLFPLEEINLMLDRITAAAATGDRLHVEAELAHWIPSYVPASTAHWSSSTS